MAKEKKSKGGKIGVGKGGAMGGAAGGALAGAINGLIKILGKK